MPQRVSKQELSAVAALPGPKRYSYFIKRVADWEEVWSLWKHGWVLASDDQSRMVVPVWSHADFAKLCSTGEWAEHEPRSIDLDSWLNKWLPGMAKDGKWVGVFPTPKNSGVVVEASRMGEDLARELENYA